MVDAIRCAMKNLIGHAVANATKYMIMILIYFKIDIMKFIIIVIYNIIDIMAVSDSVLLDATNKRLNLTSQDIVDLRDRHGDIIPIQNTTEALTNLLDKTTLKRVCCMYSDHTKTVPVRVRLPRTPNPASLTGDPDMQTIQSKIVYEDTIIPNFPLSTCKDKLDPEWKKPGNNEPNTKIR